MPKKITRNKMRKSVSLENVRKSSSLELLDKKSKNYKSVRRQKSDFSGKKVD